MFYKTTFLKDSQNPQKKYLCHSPFSNTVEFWSHALRNFVKKKLTGVLL